MLKKRFYKLLLAAGILLNGTFSFAQEAENPLFGSKFTSPQNLSDFLEATDFSVDLTCNYYLVPNYKLQSSPSTVFNSITIRAQWPNYTLISFSPSIDFSWMFFLYADGNVYPAEIENRTASIFAFMTTLPADFNLYFEKSTLQIVAGPGIFVRFATLAPNINASDTGFTGTAKSDVDSINKWLWKDLRFLYLNLCLNWDFNISSYFSAGPVIKAYLPLGAIVNGKGFSDTIFEAGLKLTF